jgi:hypothetical protein
MPVALQLAAGFDADTILALVADARADFGWVESGFLGTFG